MRMLHTMLRVGNLEQSLKFYTEVLGMQLLRKRDYEEGRFTLAFVGYGDEQNNIIDRHGPHVAVNLSCGSTGLYERRCVGALAVVAGQLQWIAQDAILKPSDSPAYEAVLWCTSRVLPNLQQFNIGDALVLGAAGVPGDAVGAVALAGVAYMAAYVFCGALLFKRREI